MRPKEARIGNCCGAPYTNIHKFVYPVQHFHLLSGDSFKKEDSFWNRSVRARHLSKASGWASEATPSVPREDFFGPRDLIWHFAAGSFVRRLPRLLRLPGQDDFPTSLGRTFLPWACFSDQSESWLCFSVVSQLGRKAGLWAHFSISLNVSCSSARLNWHYLIWRVAQRNNICFWL